MHIMQSRRDFLAGLSAAGTAGAFGSGTSLADEGPPETTTIRIAKTLGICSAPQYIADDLLRAEGFTDIPYMPTAGGLTVPQMAGRGEIDFASTFAATVVSSPGCRRAGHGAWRACIPGASSCSRTGPFGLSAT